MGGDGRVDTPALVALHRCSEELEAADGGSMSEPDCCPV